jgi:hypothetical protein
MESTATTIISLVCIAALAVFFFVLAASVIRYAFIADTDETLGREDNFLTNPEDPASADASAPMVLWLAMDEDDDMNAYVFKSRPKLDDGVWLSGKESQVVAVFPASLFPGVNFDNSPHRIEIRLINREIAK